MIRTARLSLCRRYRYELVRDWSDGAERLTCVFIGLNPSTADELTDDNTVKKCIGFAKRWGCNRLVMLNLFAFRATKPKDMYQAADPVGEHCDWWISWNVEGALLIVAAWGVLPRSHVSRAAEVIALVGATMPSPSMTCLKVNQDGSPKHPLYCPYDSALVPFSPDQVHA